MNASKKRFSLLGLLLAFALIAAACGTDGGVAEEETEETTASTEAPETTEAPTETTEAMEEEMAAPEAGPLGQVVVEAGDAIQIRSLNAITGDVAFLGIPNQRGVELAITDFGPIEGFDVDLGTGLDDLCSADGGQAAAQTIVADEQVVGVIGTSCSGAAVAAMPLISEAGLVMISGSNTSPALTSDLLGNVGTDYRDGYYRVAHNDLIQGGVAAEFVFNELSLTTAAAIHDGDPYTQGLAQAFADAFTALGGEITTFTAVNKGDTDMTPVLTEVAAGSPELLYFPIFMPEGGFIAQQIAGISGLEDTQLMGGDGLETGNFFELPESEGMYFSGPDLSFGGNESATGTNAESFLAAYDAAYGEAPSAPFWAHSYDSAVLLLTAIAETAVVHDGSLYIDRQGVRDALNGVNGVGGVTGSLTCDEFGDCGAQRIAILFHEDSSDVSATYDNIVYSGGA